MNREHYAVRIWENYFDILMKIRSQSERNALAFALIYYGFNQKLPTDLKLKEATMILFEAIKHNFIAKNQGGRKKQFDNGLQTDNEALSDKQITDKQITDKDILLSSDKSSDSKNSAVAPAETAAPKDEYVFEGEVIKLKQRNFDDWQRAYPHLNIYAECVVRDSWLKEQAETERKRWFMSTAAYFAKQNEKRKKQHEEEQQPDCAYGDYL